jgi:hypothetical protein
MKLKNMKDEPLTLDNTLSGIDISDLTSVATIGYVDSSQLTHSSDPYIFTTTSGTGTSTANFKKQPEIPTYIGVAGELFTDEDGWHWVMSKKGWRQIMNSDLVVKIEDPVKRGTKKKLKCF